MIEAEALEALARGDRKSEQDRGVALAAEESRRNIVTRGVPLNHLVDREFFVGKVRMLGTRLCEPCKYIESLLSRPGLLVGLIRRGGLRARIIDGGEVEVGSVVRLCP
jgi:MOSC domain-containing protein YiiM